MERTTRQRRNLPGKALKGFSARAAKASSVPRRRPAEKTDDSFEYECLKLLFSILAESGLPKQRLQAVANAVVERLPVSKRKWKPADLAYFPRLAHVISLWNTRPSYVDGRASPRPLPFRSSGPSLSKLIRLVFPRARPEEVLTALVKVGAVHKLRGSWIPKERSLVFHSVQVARVQILIDLIRFLRTAQYNVTHSENKLLQRSASNPAIPVRELSALQSRVLDRAGLFLEMQDAEFSRLEQNALSTDARVGTGIGIYLFRDEASEPAIVRRPSERKKSRAP